MKTKLASFIGLLVLLSSSSSSIAQTTDLPKVVYTVDETDALTYAAKAEFHAQQNGHALEDKFLAHHIVQMIRESAINGQKLDFTELMKEANEFKDESSKAIRTASGELKVNDMKEAADRFYSIFDHLPLFGEYVASLRAANDLVSDLYASSIISGTQVLAQLQNAQRVESANEIGDEVYSELHTLGRAIPNLDIVIDGVFSHDFGDVSVHDAARNIRDEDPALSSNLILRENLSADGRLSVDLQAVRQAFKELSQELTSEFHQLNGEIKELKDRSDIKNASEKELKERQDLANAQRAQEAAKLEILRTGLGLYCNLISKFDPQNGRILTSSVQAGYEISQSLSRYKQSLATFNQSLPGSDVVSFSSSFKLTTDLLQIGFSLVNSLFSSGPSPEQIILEQLSQVKDMIRELAETMQANFKLVDGKLNLILGKLDEQMSKLDQIEFGSKSMSFEITEIQRSLLSQQAQLGVLESDLLRTMERSFLSEIDRQNHKFCLESDSYTAVSFMPYADYRRCVDDFSAYASRPAHETEAPETLNSGPIGKNIGTLSKLAAKRNNFAMLPAKASSLVDPVAWSIGSTAYLKLLEARPEFARLTSIRAIQEMLSSGNELLQSLQGITALADGKGGLLSNAPFLLGWVDSYLSSVADVTKAIQTLENIYQDNPAQGTHGYPLWPEKDNVVTLRFEKSIPRCGDNRSKDQLLAPAGLNESLPAEVKALQQITGKGLELCYELRPIRTRTGTMPWTCIMTTCEDIQFAMLSIDLNASFNGKRIYSRHVESIEIAGGTPNDSDAALVDNMALLLMDSKALPLVIEGACRLNMNEFFSLTGNDRPPIPGCRYGKYIQNPLLEQLASTTIDYVSESEKAETLKYIQGKLTETLSQHRGQFRAALVDKIKRSDDVLQSLKALSESADLITAYVKLGLPKSLASNDALHASIFGKNRLLSGDDIKRLIESDSTGEEIGHLTETLTTPAIVLRNQLAEILKTPIVEPQPLVEDTMRRLKTALETQTKALPQVSLDDAWSDLRSTVSTIH